MSIEIPPKERSCLFCEHCQIQMPTSDISDVTAGEEFGTQCYIQGRKPLGHFYLFDGFIRDEEPIVLIRALTQARTCPDFKLSQKIAEELGLV